MKDIDGFLICSGDSKRQINQFKRLFAKDNLSKVSKDLYYLQMRKDKFKNDLYFLDVYVDKKLVGHFAVSIIRPSLIAIRDFEEINEMAERLFVEETNYGLKDSNGLDRVNNALLTGWGSFEKYPTITEKASALWYKLATSQFFHNGNKRTALLAAINFLVRNMYSFNYTNGNYMYDLSMKAANDEISIKQINKFIEDNVSLNYEAMASIFNGKPYFTQSVEIDISIKK